jgi:predicted PurR-regulated permease PerM
VVQRQVAQIGDHIERFGSGRDEQIERVQVTLEEKLPGDFMKDFDLKAKVDDILGGVSKGAVSAATSLLLSVASNLIYVFLLPMIVFLLLQDGPFFHYQLINAIPNRYFEVVYRLIHRVDDQLGGYIRGVMIVAFCVGSVCTLGLWICGLNYFFVIGPLMGLLNIIPIFGPMIGMAVAALAMIFQTGEIGTILCPVLVGVSAQVLDNVAFTPIAVSRSVDLHPLLVLLMTLIGGELFGLVGLILAVPLTATVKVVWQAIGEARQSRRYAVAVPSG